MSYFYFIIIVHVYLNFFHIAVKENALMEMVSCLKSDVGLVIQMPYFENRESVGFAGIYEKVCIKVWLFTLFEYWYIHFYQFKIVSLCYVQVGFDNCKIK